MYIDQLNMAASDVPLARTLIKILSSDNNPILPLRFILSMLDIKPTESEEARIRKMLEDAELGWFEKDVDYRIVDDGYGEEDVFLSRFGFELLCRRYTYSKPSRINEFAKEFIRIERFNDEAVFDVKDRLKEVR